MINIFILKHGIFGVNNYTEKFPVFFLFLINTVVIF